MTGNRRHAMRGLTVIELMVAIAIGALLLGGAATLFVNNRATYEVTNDMARMQENARFALETMLADLRMAGYVGCINNPSKVNNNTGATAGQLWDPTNLIEGIDAGGASWLPSGHAGAASDPDLDVSGFRANSDAITVRYMIGDRRDGDANDSPDLLLVNSVYSGSRTIQVDALTASDFVQTLPAALSDCGAADVFLITNDPSITGDVTASGLARAYDPINEALLSRMSGARYFVRDNASGVPALYRGVMINGGAGAPVETADELVDGVESLQILYGVDTDADGDVDAFTNAAGVANWLSVLAVRVSLLMATVDQYGAVDLTGLRYQVADQKFCSPDVVGDGDCDVVLPNDRRRRRVYESTVAVRNLQ